MLIAAVTAWGVTPLVIRLAHALGAVDHPDPRKVHEAPMPRIGGVAVFAGVALGLAFARWAGGVQPRAAQPAAVLAVTAGAMFLLGLLDDIRGVAFGWKFVAQVAAAVAAWSAGFRIDMGPPAPEQPRGRVRPALPPHHRAVDRRHHQRGEPHRWTGRAGGRDRADHDGGRGRQRFVPRPPGGARRQRRPRGQPARLPALELPAGQDLPRGLGEPLPGVPLGRDLDPGSQKGTTVVAVLVPILLLALPIADTSLAVLRRDWAPGGGEPLARACVTWRAT